MSKHQQRCDWLQVSFVLQRLSIVNYTTDIGSQLQELLKDMQLTFRLVDKQLCHGTFVINKVLSQRLQIVAYSYTGM